MMINGGHVLTVNTGLCGTPQLMETQARVSHVLTRFLTVRAVIITINASSVTILSLWPIISQAVSFLSKTVLLIQVSTQAMGLNGCVLNVRKDGTLMLRPIVVLNVTFMTVFDVCQRLNALNVRLDLTSHTMGLNAEVTSSIV